METKTNNLKHSSVYLLILIIFAAVLIHGLFWYYFDTLRQIYFTLDVGGDDNRLPKEFNNYPAWLQNLIKKEKTNSVANPPSYLMECAYKDQAVYYLSPRCCDIQSYLFDKDGKIICSPDGGLTGRGDGKCADFFYDKKSCKVIWRDERN